MPRKRRIDAPAEDDFIEGRSIDPEAVRKAIRRPEGPYLDPEPPADFTIREGVLSEATKLTTGDRNRQYGDPRADFKRTAAFWSAYLGSKLYPGESIEPHDVAAMMSCLKLSRIAETPAKRDSWVDLAGYAACGFECAAMDEQENAK